MIQFLKRHMFLNLVLSIGAVDIIMWYYGFAPSDWVEYTYNGTAVLLILFEFLKPRNRSWNLVNSKGINFRESLVEVFFFFSSALFVSVFIYKFSYYCAEEIRSFFQIDSIVSWNVFIQAIIIVLAVDFIRYWLHRWMHEYSFLWRFHALHHIPERLGVLTSTRTHPVDDLILYVPEMILLFTLGFDETIVAIMYSFIWSISLVKHSNLNFAETSFSRYFQLPRYHLIHHKYQNEKEPTYNFSEVLTVWDRIFGTHKGYEIEADHRVGVYTDKPRGIVREFLGWLFLPVNKM